jgi:hypothetical protein
MGNVIEEQDSYENLYQTKLQTLREEIEKAWDGPLSNRTVQDIINAKRPSKKN